MPWVNGATAMPGEPGPASGNRCEPGPDGWAPAGCEILRGALRITHYMYLFFLSLWRSLLLAAHALATPFEKGRRLSGALLIIVGLPVFLAWQALHWLGMLLDEIFFRGYRKVEIRAPLFVVGPPRTGTTHLHHVLSADPQTTTFRTWECLFGLSVTARYVGLGLFRGHRMLGSPFNRVGRWLGKKVVGDLEDIHPIRMTDPEEDFLALMPALACFLIAIPLPRAHWLWRLARFDTHVGRTERTALLTFYRRAIQRHLYVFGEDKRFLSKNASFAGMTDGLLEAFPDARIIATVRDPLSVAPSQLSSLRPALALCGYREVPDRLRDDLLRLLEYYFMNLKRSAGEHPGRIAFIENAALRDALAVSVRRALGELGVPVSADLERRLGETAAATATKVSKHRYTLGEFGLTDAVIRSRFAPVYASFRFGPAQPVTPQDDQ